MPRTPLRQLALAWLAGVVVLAVLKAPTLHDAHYWDALGCYVFQGRLLAERWSLRDAAIEGFVRPPGFVGLVALTTRAIGDTRPVLHGLVLGLAALVAPGLLLLVRHLGGALGTAVLAFGLCAASPHFFAQAGLVQSDLPATAWATLALGLLLDGRLVGYALCGTMAALSKESSAYLCLLAAWVLLVRGPLAGGEPLLAALRRRPAAVLRALLIAGVPGFALVTWLCVHRQVTGAFLFHDHVGVLGPGSFPWALRHNVLDGGRFVLVLCALPALRALGDPARRGLPALPLRAVAAVALGLPLFFPAALPRYMLPALPPQAALAAVGLCLLGRRRAILAGTAGLALLLLGMGGRYSRADVAHLEVSMAYRDLLRLHREAAQALAAAKPRLVLTDFPMTRVLTVPPQDGFLPSPLPVRHVSGDEPLGELCRADYLVVAQGRWAHAARQRLAAAGALTPFRTYDGPLRTAGEERMPEEDSTVRIFRVRCP